MTVDTEPRPLALELKRIAGELRRRAQHLAEQGDNARTEKDAQAAHAAAIALLDDADTVTMAVDRIDELGADLELAGRAAHHDRPHPRAAADRPAAATVNAAQATAIAHPCLLAQETAHPRFAHLADEGSVVLTVNRGYE